MYSVHGFNIKQTLHRFSNNSRCFPLHQSRLQLKAVISNTSVILNRILMNPDVKFVVWGYFKRVAELWIFNFFFKENVIKLQVHLSIALAT